MSEVNVLPDIVHNDFMDILKDGSDFEQVFYINDDLVSHVSSLEENFNQISGSNVGSQYSLSSLDGFDPSFSASDSSLADENSPQDLTFPTTDYNHRYVYQNSPGTASVDSGVTSDPCCPESPQLSPTSGSVNYLDYIDAYGNMVDSNMKVEEQTVIDAISEQQQQLLVKLINQQVQQALLQHQQQQQQQQQQLQLQQQMQQKQQITQQIQQENFQQVPQQKQGLAMMQAQLQQQLLQLTQQQQQQQQSDEQQKTLLQQVSSQVVAANQSKNDSQLRKMLMQTKTNFTQTKNNIINSIHDTKGKISNFKFPKPGMKPNKRKGSPAPEISPKMEKKMNNSVVSLHATSPGFQYPDGIEGIMYQDNKRPSTQQLQRTSMSQISSLMESASPIEQITSFLDSESPIPSPPSDNENCPSKMLISRLKNPTSATDIPIKMGKAGIKRTRVEHVVIEKRYRMKITDSLNELKTMLNCSDDKKATKNAILQAAIDELKRLKKVNESLAKKNRKMRNLFEELRNIGIIPASQTVSSSGSESNNTEERDQRIESIDDEMEPEVNQDHYASPFQRQSTRDAGKLVTCFTIFVFLFMNPLAFFAAKPDIASDVHYKSRHLLSTGPIQEASPQYYLATNLINIVLSFFILMFIVLRGNPHSSRVTKNSKLTVCYTSQLRKAQKKINKHEYDDAKDFLRIALFVVGNSCPKTTYGQLASFLWKCCCHILYQLGVVTAMTTIGRLILPKSISLADEKEVRELAAKLSAEAYRKLHEVAVKDPNSTYMETACYLMNFIYSAEVSSDHEVLCTAYATAVVHMKEKVMYPSILQYYFTGCAHHVSLASKDDYPFAIDWIFETRGYEYFANGSWDVQKTSHFYVHCGDSDLDEPDLLQMVYAQFQDYLLSKALKRLVAPDTFYPNEGKIELRQRTMSFLNTVGTGPISEHLDNMSIYQQSLYGWWGAVLKHLVGVMKHIGNSGNENMEMTRLIELYDNIDEKHRHEMVELMKHVTSAYTGVKLLQHNLSRMLPSEQHTAYNAIKEDLTSATQLIQRIYANKQKDDNGHEDEEEEQIDINELLLLFCCDLMLDGRYTLWRIGCFKPSSDEQLNEMMSENQVLESFTSKYEELQNKVQDYDYQIQMMCGINQPRLRQAMHRIQRVDSVCSKMNELDYYHDNRQYPVRAIETKNIIM